MTPSEDTVVFVGGGWLSFEQMCAVLQQHGVNTHWIGYPYSRLRRIRTSLFTPVSTASTPAELHFRLEAIGPERILDIITSEYDLDDVVTAAQGLHLRPWLRDDLARRRSWLDKDRTMQRLGEAGVRVPRQARDGAKTDEIVADLGLPVVVKGRIGGGGVTVRVCHDRGEVADALTELERRGGTFAEEFCESQDELCYAAAYADDRVLAEVIYLGQRSAGSDAFMGETGPLDEQQTLDDPDMFELGQQAVRAIGGRGLMNIDVIRRPDGQLTVVDVNQRPWGSVVTLRATGVDFVGAYLAALRDEPFEPVRVEAGQRVNVFSTTAVNEAMRKPLAGLALFVRHGAQHARWTGPRYVAAEFLQASTQVAGSWAKRVRRGGGIGSGHGQ